MSLRYLFAATFFLVWGLQGTAQTAGNQRSKKIPAALSVQRIDSLSILQVSFSISGPDSKPLDPAFYQVDFVNAILRLRIPDFWKDDSLLVRYRVFPIHFSEPYFHKDTSLIRVPGPGEETLTVPLTGYGGSQGLIPTETLISSGSITRGITLGNRQDVALNSAMNLQLSGSLSPEIEVAAVISDQDIPFQPDGTTRQLQDFDKVFIQLSGMGGQLTAGDFELERPGGYFMNFSRRAQGGMAQYSARVDSTQGFLPGAKIDVRAAGAIAKGKYARNQIVAVEGNQGPYRLTGAGNESYIMVLAGSERVFIDGLLLLRGMNHDYVIDYNMAEVTFTSRRMISRNSRIVVEFEYAERNYARSIVFSGVEIKTQRTALRFNFFSEQDHPNQPLFQELSDERIEIMSRVGDNLHLAFDWNTDSTGFFNDRVMYRLTDSLGMDTVFVYSTDPLLAVHRVGFTYMGQGMGNYIQVSSAANGRVFQWIAPAQGIPQGTHDPIIVLTTPKKDQMMTMGADFQLSPNTIAGIEMALSTRDLNLFSVLDKEDNTGYALRINMQNTTPLPRWGDGNWGLQMLVNHEVSGTNFSPLERYRPIEFERDWNLGVQPLPTQEHLSMAEVQLLHPGAGRARYRFRSLIREDTYQGFINSLDANLMHGRNKLFFDGSLLNSQGNRHTSFYRHKAGFSRPLFFVTAGLEHQTEHNNIATQTGDPSGNESFYFDEWTVFITNPETRVNRYRLFYTTRLDRIPLGDRMTNATRSRDVGVSWEFLQNPDQRIHLTAMQRRLRFLQTQDATQNDESNLAGRIDYFSRWGQGMITSSLFYEAGSGLEREREYIYLEVPAGQGVYTWNDYNSNGIMELDEFELAQFPDQANFIRVFIPTEGFVKVFSNVLSHTVNIDPAIKWRNAQGIKKWLARFNNQLVYRIDRKTQGGITPAGFNPFGYALDNEALVSMNASFRNTLSFNRAHPVFGAEFMLHDSRNKMLLSNGFETRVLQSSGIRTRWNMTRQYSLNIHASRAIKDNRSGFFLARNYRLQQYDLEPTVSYQLDGRYRLSVFAGVTQKRNLLSLQHETARIKRVGAELRYNAPGQRSLSGRYQISGIEYPFEQNTPLAFEMLEGLRSGTNHLWNISWQQNLNTWLQLVVAYHGRNPPGLKAVHSGNMQLRALF